MVLTDDALAVQTAANYYPAGTAMVTVYPLPGADTPAASFRADHWLAATMSETLLFTPRLLDEYRTDVQTVLQVGFGRELGSIRGVNRIRRSGWVEQYVDPDAAAAILKDEDPDQLADALLAQPRRLLHPATGTTVAIGALLGEDVVLPHGYGMLLHHCDDTDCQPTSWIEAPGEGTKLRTDDMSHLDSEGGVVELVTLPMSRP